jgi:hypothetical protein
MREFADSNEIMEAVQSWLKATPKSFFLEGILKLVDRWTKCVVKQGDYVEK